jgi:putative Holliday junction resolvase
VRIIGLDIGERRIGVAAADDRTRVAIPVTTVTVEGNAVEAVLAIAREQNADELVVGLPLSMTGALGPQGQLVMELVDSLRERLSIPVHTWDERLTSVQAGRSLGGARRKSARTAMAGRDAIAAAIILQAFVDSRR